MEVFDEKWRVVKGNRKFMSSDLGRFMKMHEGEHEWRCPNGFDDEEPIEMIARTWFDMKKNQRVEFIDCDRTNWAVANMRVVDVPKNLTIKMKFNKDQITKEMVDQVLKYVPETGAFLVKTRRPNVGSEAWKHAGEVGTYYMISLFGQWYKAQEIAVLVKLGNWPCASVSVANGNWGDARWSNILM